MLCDFSSISPPLLCDFNYVREGVVPSFVSLTFKAIVIVHCISCSAGKSSHFAIFEEGSRISGFIFLGL